MASTTKVKMAPDPSEEVVEEEVEAVAVEPEAEEVEVNEPETLEDLDPNEELWDGGPKIKQVLAWKEEYGDVYVTSISLDHHILWRRLTRPEYTDHMGAMEDLADQMSPAMINLVNEEVITKLCALYGYDPDDKKQLAGVPSIIAQEVMEASGFVALEVRRL